MSTATDGQALRVKTVFGDYPHTAPIKDGTVRSPRLDLDFTVVKPTNRAFMPMVRELKFDVCEMAIVTFLITLSFFLSTPGVPAPMGFPAISGHVGQFILKDAGLLGISIWLLGQALIAAAVGASSPNVSGGVT